MSRLSEHLLHLQCRLPLPDLQVFFSLFYPPKPGIYTQQPRLLEGRRRGICSLRFYSAFPDCRNYARLLPACGQPVHTHRLSLQHILHDLIHVFIPADKGAISLAR